MTLTKKQLINALYNLDIPDDTIVVKRSGIGFEDINDIDTQPIVNWSVDYDGLSINIIKEHEILAIILD